MTIIFLSNQLRVLFDDPAWLLFDLFYLGMGDWHDWFFVDEHSFAEELLEVWDIVVDWGEGGGDGLGDGVWLVVVFWVILGGWLVVEGEGSEMMFT